MSHCCSGSRSNPVAVSRLSLSILPKCSHDQIIPLPSLNTNRGTLTVAMLALLPLGIYLRGSYSGKWSLPSGRGRFLLCFKDTWTVNGFWWLSTVISCRRGGRCPFSCVTTNSPAHIKPAHGMVLSWPCAASTHCCLRSSVLLAWLAFVVALVLCRVTVSLT